MTTDESITDPIVRDLIDAINSGERDAFFALLAADATLSDDGTERDLTEWVDKEIFTVSGHLDVESVTDGGRFLIARFRNDTWGTMRTRWHFTVVSDKISRIEAGQA